MSQTVANTDEDTPTFHRLVIVGCGGSKADKPMPAKSIYRSNYFKLKRAYAEAFGQQWMILSAEHQLLMPSQEIEPYETSATDPGFDAGAFVLELIESLGEHAIEEYDEVVLLAGKKYRQLFREALDLYESRTSDEFLNPDQEVWSPFERFDLGGVGYQMQWLKRAVEHDDPERLPFE